MRKYTIIIILLAFSAFPILAQNVTKVKAQQSGQEIIITYALDKEANISVYYVNETNRTPVKLNSVYGDAGSNVKVGNNTITWKVLEEYPTGFSSDNIAFIVEATTSSSNLKSMARKSNIKSLKPWVGVDCFAGYPGYGFSAYVPIGIPIMGLYGNVRLSNYKQQEIELMTVNIGPSFMLGKRVTCFAAPGVWFSTDEAHDRSVHFSMHGGVGVSFLGIMGLTAHVAYPLFIGVGVGFGLFDR